jgi:hypothetical protein
MLGSCVGQANLQQQSGILAIWELVLLDMQEVRWENVGTVRAYDYNLFY